MELKIINEVERPLMGRKELMLSMNFTGSTPKNIDVKKAVANAAKAKEELVVVKKIMQKFGFENAEVIAYVYHDAESLKRFNDMQKKKVLKAQREEALKKHKEAKAAAQKKEEKPAEQTPAPAQ